MEGTDGLLYALVTRRRAEADPVVERLLVVPTVMRGRLVVTKHGSAAGGHRAAAEVEEILKRRYTWLTMHDDVAQWIASCGCQQKKGRARRKVWARLAVARRS